MRPWQTVLVIVAALLLALGYYLFDSRANPRPDVGDCLTAMPGGLRLSSPDIVDCDDPDAAYRVTRSLDGGTGSTTHEEICGSLRDGESYVHRRSGGSGTNRTFSWAICAAPVDR